MTPDALRLLAIEMLEKSRGFLPSSHSAQEAVIKAYNDGCCDFEDAQESDLLHPATDAWILAHKVALGALHEPSCEELAAAPAIDYAIGMLEELVATPKAASA